MISNICLSCGDDLDWPSGDGCANMTAHLTSGAAKMLAEQDCDYNRKTNDLIKRHAEQVKALTAERDDALECNEQFFVYNQFLKKRVEKAEAERDRLRELLVDTRAYLEIALNVINHALKGEPLD